MKRFRGLNIVVPVKKNGRFAGRVERFGVDQRVKRRRDDLNRFKSRGAKIVVDPTSRAFDVRFVLRFGANAGNTKKLLQFSKMLVAACVNEFGQSHRDSRTYES